MELLKNNFLYNEKSYHLIDHVVVRCKGNDTVRFLNGQLTNDVSSLHKNEFQGQVRLDRTGKVQFFFYLLRTNENYYIVCHEVIFKELLEDLDKYIIMDDLSFELTEQSVHLNFHHQGKSFFGALPCDMNFDTRPTYEMISYDEFFSWALLGGEPVWDQTIIRDQLVTDSIAMLDCVSLKKGCFLGQETVAKIESRRGGAYFPVALTGNTNSPDKVLKIEGKIAAKYIASCESHDIVFLKREYRVQGKEIVFDNGERKTVKYLPLWEKLNREQRAVSLYEKGALYFQEGKEDQAIQFMKEAILVKPDYADAYESLGVIYGRHEKYDEAIKLMDQLSMVDPDSVMAHTNKSLFLMKIGKIEEAEEEKAQATLKTFAMYGKEAKNKKESEEKKKREDAELLRREEMFRQVLELDSEDALAGYGLADIEFHRNNYQNSITLLDKVLESNPKYSVAYLLLSKALMAIGNERAKEILVKGIDVASHNGDLMPANSMQELLNKLN